jgi:nucleoside 2-deoxyribosyltransferase
MKVIYIAHPMTAQAGTEASMSALAAWLKKQRGCRVFEPNYQLFSDILASQALKNLEDSSIILADVSSASHGVGFEIGFAFSKGKRVILVAHEERHGTISSFLAAMFSPIVFFNDSEDLIAKVSDLLKSTRSTHVKRKATASA